MDNIIGISINVLAILLIWAAVTGLMVLVTKGLRKLFEKNTVLTSVNIAVGVLVVGAVIYTANKSEYDYGTSIARTEPSVTATAELSNPVNNAETEYIGNKQSGKFHRPSCEYIPDENNRIIYKTREDAINAGMIPCKICNP